VYEGALAVYDYATTLPYVDSSQIVSMGYSLGTGSAVYLAAKRPVKGLILAAPYANGYDLYNSVFPIYWGMMSNFAKHKFPSDEYAPHVTCPTLIIASRSDEIVPFESSKQLLKLFRCDMDFMELNYVTHNNIFLGIDAHVRIQDFLETLE
jgi:dienelactone hydrolase